MVSQKKRKLTMSNQRFEARQVRALQRLKARLDKSGREATDAERVELSVLDKAVGSRL
jgi:hypothetical protein